jgi:hypothetical protein
MQTEVRSDGGMKLHMLQAPSWNQNPSAESMLRWSGSVPLKSGSVPPNSLSALWQTLVEPDPSGKSPEQLINEWVAKLSVPGYYLGTFVTKPQASNGTYGQKVTIQVLITSRGDPVPLLSEIKALVSAPAPLKDLLTNYGLTNSAAWIVQNLSFGGPGVACILAWTGVLNSQTDLDALRNYLSTPLAGALPENLVNDALAKLLVGYYLGTFVGSATFPAKVQVLVGLNSTLRSDEELGNPNDLADNEYNLRTMLRIMSDTIQTFPNALAALSGLLQKIGSSINAPDPPWFMLSQMDVRVIDPSAP